MTRWRPKDWKNPYVYMVEGSIFVFIKTGETVGTILQEEELTRLHQCYEESADAMLDVVLKYLSFNSTPYQSDKCKGQKSPILFILPEDLEKLRKEY